MLVGGGRKRAEERAEEREGEEGGEVGEEEEGGMGIGTVYIDREGEDNGFCSTNPLERGRGRVAGVARLHVGVSKATCRRGKPASYVGPFYCRIEGCGGL